MFSSTRKTRWKSWEDASRTSTRKTGTKNRCRFSMTAKLHSWDGTFPFSETIGDWLQVCLITILSPGGTLGARIVSSPSFNILWPLSIIMEEPWQRHRLSNLGEPVVCHCWSRSGPQVYTALSSKSIKCTTPASKIMIWRGCIPNHKLLFTWLRITMAIWLSSMEVPGKLLILILSIKKHWKETFKQYLEDL